MTRRDEIVHAYEAHAEELVKFATFLVGPSAASDIVAEAVLRAVGSAGWGGVRDARACLHRIVLNEAHIQARSDERRQRRETQAAGGQARSAEMALPNPEIRRE